MMAEALAEPVPVRHARPANRLLVREVLFRDGLILALLAACPLRRRSFVGLEPGRHLVRHSDCYRLQLEPGDLKNGTDMTVPLPVSLTPWLDHYLALVRPRLLQGRESPKLWVSREGTRHDLQQPCAYGSRRSRAAGSGGGSACTSSGTVPPPAWRWRRPSMCGRSRLSSAIAGLPRPSATTTWPRARPLPPPTRRGSWRSAAGCRRRHAGQGGGAEAEELASVPGARDRLSHAGTTKHDRTYAALQTSSGQGQPHLIAGCVPGRGVGGRAELSA